MNNDEYSFGQFFRDVAHYISPYRGQFITGSLLRLTSDIAHLYPAWAISSIILILSKPINSEGIHKILITFVIWGAVSIYFSITHNLSKYIGYQVAEKASFDIYKDCLSHIFKLDYAWQETENSGNKMKRLDKGSEGIDVTIRRVFDVLIEVVVNTIGIVIIFFTLEKNIAFSLIFFITSYYLIGNYLNRKAVLQEQVVNKAFENLGGITYESLNNIQTIKALSIDSGVIKAVKQQIDSLLLKIQRRIFLFRIQSGTLISYQSLFEFVVIIILVWGIINGRYDISLLSLFIGLFQKVSESAGELAEVTQQLALAKIWVWRAMSILQIQPIIEHPKRIVLQNTYPQEWKEIKINNLEFSYKKRKALRDISLTIKRGEKVGIVGLSGSGKSTFFKLLLDLYEDYSGEIAIDGIPLKKMSRQSYIDHVAVVLQDTELFDMTLKENIEIAAVESGVKDSEFLDEVLKMSHLEDVIEQLPDGVNTIVGEKGIRLSGGQRQRVGIARALYRQPDILLLDEATSHLDAHSEKEIQKALEECMHKFTTIVIAHRLSTIKAMDKIVVLERGKIVEQGSFDELLVAKGVFARMWQDQKI